MGMSSYHDDIVFGPHGEPLGCLLFDSSELRGIADALGPDDKGGDEMRELADRLDRLTGDAE
jgi:hypothetical protein